jgi:hypothetical protein
MKSNVSRSTLFLAYAIAICADFIQICLMPLFSEGFISPFDDFSDVIVCLILCRLIGFHVAFLPSFFIKLIPVVEIAPTWTIAVLIATRNLHAPAANTTAAVDVKADVVVEDEKPPKTSSGKNT